MLRSEGSDYMAQMFRRVQEVKNKAEKAGLQLDDNRILDLVKG